MNLLQVTKLVILLLILIVQCDGKTEIADYIVDCSACNTAPVPGVKAYNCKVRCTADDERVGNLTGLYDMLVQMSEELQIVKLETEREIEAAKQRQRATEEELITTKLEVEAIKMRQLLTEEKLTATRGVLNTDVAFTAQFGARISVSGGQKIVFTNVITNVGDAYKGTTGIFTAPRNGTYTFTLITMTTNNNHWAYLSVNGIITSRVHAREYWLIGATTFNKKLVVGDKVWAESSETDTYHESYTMFTGNIIHVDY